MCDVTCLFRFLIDQGYLLLFREYSEKEMEVLSLQDAFELMVRKNEKAIKCCVMAEGQKRRFDGGVQNLCGSQMSWMYRFQARHPSRRWPLHNIYDHRHPLKFSLESTEDPKSAWKDWMASPVPDDGSRPSLVIYPRNCPVLFLADCL